MQTTFDPRIGTLTRDGETIYYAHIPLTDSDKRLVSGEFIYVEHRDAEQVAAYLPK